MPKEEARVQALGALYATDVLSREAVDTSTMSTRAAALAEGTWENRAEIDALIESVSTSWRVDRMPAVDRNIVRLATFEILFNGLSKAIAIDQAVELAKTHSTARSGAFVNGVLSAIADRGRDVADPPDTAPEPEGSSGV